MLQSDDTKYSSGRQLGCTSLKLKRGIWESSVQIWLDRLRTGIQGWGRPKWKEWAPELRIRDSGVGGGGTSNGFRSSQWDRRKPGVAQWPGSQEKEAGPGKGWKSNPLMLLRGQLSRKTPTGFNHMNRWEQLLRVEGRKSESLWEKKWRSVDHFSKVSCNYLLTFIDRMNSKKRPTLLNI